VRLASGQRETDRQPTGIDDCMNLGRQSASRPAHQFIWIPRQSAPAYYDRIMDHCQQAGLQPGVVQEGMDGSALLSLVAVGMGLSFVPASARPRCPEDVALVPVPDLTVELTLEFVWRAGEDYSALARFIEITTGIAAVNTLPA